MSLPGLAGWIYSQPLGTTPAGGDLYYLSVCGQGRLARVAVADITGHGESVSPAADCLRQLLRKHIDTFDQSVLARDLNQSVQQECLAAKLATAVLLGIDASSGELILTNGGHPPPLWYQARRQRWRLLQEAIPHTENELADLPLGAIPGTDYHQIVARLEPGDLVLAYSDGLSDVRNPGGELLQPEGLLELARRGRMGSPAAVGRDLLRAVDHYRGGASRTDDETLMVFERLAAAA